ncbi:hypothetical protein [Jiangella asiatica]|nr:hypothetical protein [Jiangella asiatica]
MLLERLDAGRPLSTVADDATVMTTVARDQQRLDDILAAIIAIRYT